VATRSGLPAGTPGHTGVKGVEFRVSGSGFRVPRCMENKDALGTRNPELGTGRNQAAANLPGPTCLTPFNR
jgi:hypothetical protein